MVLTSVLIGVFTKFKNLWIAKRTLAAILWSYYTGGTKNDTGGLLVYLQCEENPDMYMYRGEVGGTCIGYIGSLL